ncbi:hypothetical protein SLA2020_023140 [Shorea laevis]
MRFPANNLSGVKFQELIFRIKESSRCGQWQQVFSHYLEMNRSGVQSPDPSVFPPILKACLNLSSGSGKSVHASLIKQGCVLFASVGNSIMDFYIKSGNMESAVFAFDSLGSRVDSVSWNIMIHGHLDLGFVREGLWWFAQARIDEFEPNTSILVFLVQVCRSVVAYQTGSEVHGYLIRSGFSAINSVQNSLLSLYADGDMECARKLFDETCERDVISWNVIIVGYIQTKEPQVSLQLFREMLSVVGIQPDGITVASVLKACTKVEDIHMGKVVHGMVMGKGFNDDLFIGNSLIDMYSKCKDVDSAFCVFFEMPRKNNVSWNSIMSGFVLHGKYSRALSLFNLMWKEGVQEDEVTLVNLLQVCKYFMRGFLCKSVHSVMIRRGYELNELVVNSLLDAYAKCNLVDIAWKLFDGLKRRGVVLWSTMIAGLTHCGRADEAIRIFNDMTKAEERPTTITIINLLEACSISAELKMSKWAHGIAIQSGLAANVAVGTAILHMYSKCGAVETSRKVFDQIPLKNIVSWSAMVAAYGINGLPREALALIAEMKLHGMRPNTVTALSVLSACSHGGLIEEGLAFFKSMVQDHGIEPGLDHYSCLIDMLGRAGMLDAAIELIDKMPNGLKAGGSAWGAILSACRTYGNSELGTKALAHLLKIEPFNSSGYLLAFSMHAADSSWDDAARMRVVVSERGLRVSTGYSLVHVGNKDCRFVAGDCSNARAGDISNIVKQLHGCIGINERTELGDV